MVKILKNGEIREQLHLYCSPKIYGDFKESIKQLNNNTGKDYGISEIIRACMIRFSNSPEFQQMIISTINAKGGANYE